MRPEGDAVLIAAQSGRALAQAARRAGLRPFVLDLFGDEDTLGLSEAHRTMPGRFGASLAGGDAVMAGLDALAARIGAPPLGVVLGSGFEGAPRLMARIGRRHRLIGASPETVAILKDPMRFSALCCDLAIPHPSVTTEPVADRGAWLCKRAGGSGGTHVRSATRGPAPPGHYFQVRVPGKAFGFSFVADGRSSVAIAVTEQWSRTSALRPYRYGGAIERGRDEQPVLERRFYEDVAGVVDRLVFRTGLRGLASADLLVDGARWWLLEINPRPGATLDVLDRRASPLLATHVEASLGRLPRRDSAPTDAAGSEICYAARRYLSVPFLDWPDGTRDRPRAGSRVARDAPLCTVTVTAPRSDAVKQELRERARIVAARLDETEDIRRDRDQATAHQRADGAAHRSFGR